MKSWIIYWAPEGRPIDVVTAASSRQAIRKAPLPYSRYLGEIYAVEA